MNDAAFHWRKFEAAQWLLSQLTINERRPIFHGSRILGAPVPPPNRFDYKYEEFSFSEIKKYCQDFSDDELTAALSTLDINGHIHMRPDNSKSTNPLVKMKDEGRKAYETLYYLSLRDQQKNTNVGLQNAENSLGDFLKGQWYRHRNYIIVTIGLSVSLVLLLLRLVCNR